MKAFFFRLVLKDSPKTKITVCSFSGVEALSELYKFHIHAYTLGFFDDCRSFFLKKATLEILDDRNKVVRVFHGVLSEIELIGVTQDNKARFRFTLMPQILLLGKKVFNKTFLNTSMPEVVREIISKESYEVKFYNRYPIRPIFFQHEQSSLDFLQNILSQKGAYYYFEQQLDCEKIIILDDNLGHQERATEKYFGSINKHKHDKKCLGEIYSWEKFLPKGSCVSGFATHMQKYLCASTDEFDSADYQYYDESISDQNTARREAEVTLQRFNCNARGFYGKSREMDLRLGEFYKVARDPLTHKILITAIHHRAGHHSKDIWSEKGNSFYEGRFQAIDAQTPFRPKEYKKRTIKGVLPARIIKRRPGTAENLGQYKVRFENKNNCESCWLSFAQYFNCGNSGFSFNLSTGTKVLVQFFQGNPDLPFILGCFPDDRNLKLVTATNQQEYRLKSADAEIRLVDGPDPHILLETGNTREKISDRGLKKETDNNSVVIASGTKQEFTFGFQMEAVAGDQIFTALGVQLVGSVGGLVGATLGPTVSFCPGNSFNYFGQTSGWIFEDDKWTNLEEEVEVSKDESVLSSTSCYLNKARCSDEEVETRRSSIEVATRAVSESRTKDEERQFLLQESGNIDTRAKTASLSVESEAKKTTVTTENKSDVLLKSADVMIKSARTCIIT